ncbi:MAG TPA: acyltransferase [Mycobacteriales bacterium]|nr:acyltransferase [Mycobacteriales bacterium]
MRDDVTRGRLPQLDGLRCVAVAMVVLAHLGFLLQMSVSTRRLLSPVLLNDGVELFFILSGFLITAILLRERERAGHANLRLFYLRRVLRIVPAFYVFLLVVGLLAAAGRADVTGRDLAASAVYVWDYVPHVVPWIEHTWSLAVEEQFYLLWPFLLVLLRPRRAAALAALLIAAAPVVRVLTYVGAHKPGATAHARMDALLIGCLLALAPVAWPVAYRRVATLLLRWRVDAVGAIAYLLVLPYLLSPFVQVPVAADVRFAVGLTLEAVAGALLLFGLVERPAGMMSRTLALPPLRHLGVVSYSIYLWQQPFLIPQVELPVGVRIVGLLVLAEASHWLVERPFLRLKRRFEACQSTALPISAAAVADA